MPTAATRKRPSKAKPGRASPAAAPRLTRNRRPPELPVADWQTALRQQFGREQLFGLENLGSEPVFSEFRVHNPASKSSYRVTIRGQALGLNRCTCPDFATNDLGTCKHIEFTLGRLSAKRGGKKALAAGFAPNYSEIWLDHAGLRQVRLRIGSDCPPALREAAETWFDATAGWALPRDRLDGLDTLLRLAQVAGHDLRCHDAVWPFVAQIRDTERRQAALAEAYPQGAHDPALTQMLKVPLYAY